MPDVWASRLGHGRGDCDRLQGLVNDLLEACEIAEQSMHLLMPTEMVKHFESPRYMLQAAIAKATGEED